MHIQCSLVPSTCIVNPRKVPESDHEQRHAGGATGRLYRSTSRSPRQWPHSLRPQSRSAPCGKAQCGAPAPTGSDPPASRIHAPARLETKTASSGPGPHSHARGGSLTRGDALASRGSFKLSLKLPVAAAGVRVAVRVGNSAVELERRLRQRRRARRGPSNFLRCLAWTSI